MKNYWQQLLVLIALFLSYWSQKLWSLADPKEPEHLYFLFSGQWLTPAMHYWFIGNHIREILLLFALARMARLITSIPLVVVLLMDFLLMTAVLDVLYYLLFYSSTTLFTIRQLDVEFGDAKFVLISVATAMTGIEIITRRK